MVRSTPIPKDMPYTVNQLAKLAGVSVRTLHYYDEVGLLKPSSIAKNGYRHYEEDELLKLQQILFFRELELPLTEITRIVNKPDFDTQKSLVHHRHLVELKQKRLTGLLKTIDKTIDKLTHKTTMEDKDLYGGFTQEEMDAFSTEAKERWGNTEAYKQSTERVKKMSKEDLKELARKGEEWTKNLSTHMDEDPKSEGVQKMIAEHYNGLRTFYEPSLELYRGLANMYVDDPRFTHYYDKHRPGLAKFMKEAMLYYAEAEEGKK
jgi:DNA-binding transcriptional MerR regulator